MWRVEKKLYAIYTLVLPVPLDLLKLAYFIFFVAVFFIASQLFPPIAAFPLMFKYGIFPFLLTKFFMSQKLDGKPPQKFFAGYISHMRHRKEYFERFKMLEEPKTGAKERFDWYCSAEISMDVKKLKREKGLRDGLPYRVFH